MGISDFVSVMFGGRTKAEKAEFIAWLDRQQAILGAEIAREESRVTCYYCSMRVYPRMAKPIYMKDGTTRYLCDRERWCWT